jgi:hypothetical protein
VKSRFPVGNSSVKQRSGAAEVAEPLMIRTLLDAEVLIVSLFN